MAFTQNCANIRKPRPKQYGTASATPEPMARKDRTGATQTKAKSDERRINGGRNPSKRGKQSRAAASYSASTRNTNCSKCHTSYEWYRGRIRTVRREKGRHPQRIDRASRLMLVFQSSLPPDNRAISILPPGNQQPSTHQTPIPQQHATCLSWCDSPIITLSDKMRIFCRPFFSFYLCIHSSCRDCQETKYLDYSQFLDVTRVVYSQSVGR